MAEHSVFLQAGFTPANASFAKTAGLYQEHFEVALYNAIMLGSGVVSPKAIESGEFVTDYTLACEQKTQSYTGIKINRGITEMEVTLCGSAEPQITQALHRQVKTLNANISALLDRLIQFKKQVADKVFACEMFTASYPMLLHHILHEAQMYKSCIDALEAGRNPNDSIKETDLFWDHIMLEHAGFIRGLLDPSENALINTANNFAVGYNKLIQTTKAATNESLSGVVSDTLQETLKYRDFKKAGAKGIAECKIRSVILPLMADHVLREANYFVRLLGQV